MCEISVVIPVYNAEEIIEKTLWGLHNQSIEKDAFEVIIVDDCGNDKSMDVIGCFKQKSDIDLSITRHKENLGTYAAYNTGVRYAKHPIILFLDQDCVPDVRLLEEHLTTHKTAIEPSVVIGRFIWHKDIQVHPYLKFFRPNSETLLIEPQNIFDMELEQFITGNCSIRKEYFNEMGGFDEEFIYGFGDTEFGYRWRQKGYKIIGNINAVVSHLHKMDFSAQLRRKHRIGTQSPLYCDKHPELSHNAGLVNAQSRKYMEKLYYGILEYFYHLGIRETLNIATEKELELAKLLLEQDWDQFVD